MPSKKLFTRFLCFHWQILPKWSNIRVGQIFCPRLELGIMFSNQFWADVVKYFYEFLQNKYPRKFGNFCKFWHFFEKFVCIFYIGQINICVNARTRACSYSLADGNQHLLISSSITRSGSDLKFLPNFSNFLGYLFCKKS